MQRNRGFGGSEDPKQRILRGFGGSETAFWARKSLSRGWEASGGALDALEARRFPIGAKADF